MTFGFRRNVVVGLLISSLGVSLSALPLVRSLEADAELGWLFALRGAINAPEQIVIVGIDAETSNALSLSDELNEWPRSIHATLVRGLADAGAETIIFDLNFSELREGQGDDAFASAMADAGNVILLEFLEPVTREDFADEDFRVVGARRILHPLFRSSALGSAPFPLPVVPVRVDEWWRFVPTANETIPTLPVVALQAFLISIYDEFVTSVGRSRLSDGSDIPASMQLASERRALDNVVSRIRESMSIDPGETDAGMAEDQRLVVLTEMYAREDRGYLNFYGPPRTVQTFAYHDVVDSVQRGELAFDVAGKAVFVGYSDSSAPSIRDSFYSVFSDASGLNLSGVEIAATAFGNLLENRSIERLPDPVRFLFVFLWGGVLFLLIRELPMLKALGVVLVVGLAYLWFVSSQFSLFGAWWPISVPLLIQAPLSLYAATRLQLVDQREQRLEFDRRAVARLHPEIRHRLTVNAARLSSGERKSGICLLTDVIGYSRWEREIIENHGDETARSLKQEYRELLASSVAKHGGIVQNIVGDAMMAIWLNTDSRLPACDAATSIHLETSRSENKAMNAALPTRIGLVDGVFMVGDIGTSGYETELSGNALNEVERVMSANKILGTRILTSGTVLRGLENEVSARELGAFRLKDIPEPIVLHELIDTRNSDRDKRGKGQFDAFEAALDEFRQERWGSAAEHFDRVLCDENFKYDGPTRFYSELLRLFRAELIESDLWDGESVRLFQLPGSAPFKGS